MKRAAEHTTCIKKCLCGFSFNPKQIFKLLQSQKLKLLRTVTHRPKLFFCALCIYDSCQACQSLSGFLCVRSQCTSVMNVCIRMLWHLDALLRSLRESNEEERCKGDGMREGMWAETSRKSADVKEEWSVKRRKQCRKKKGEGWMGWWFWMGRSLRRRALASLYHVLPLHPSQETVLGSRGCLSNQKGKKRLCVS